MAEEKTDAWDPTKWHEVKKGKTLWKIGETYYRNGSLYTKIFEANRNHLEGPQLDQSGTKTSNPMNGGGKRIKKWLKPMVLMVLVLFAAACASDNKRAEKAIKAAEAAINAAKDEAMKYFGDQVKGLEDEFKAAKDAFAKKDYKAALNEAKDLPGKAKDLANIAAAAARWSSKVEDQSRCSPNNQGAPCQLR